MEDKPEDALQLENASSPRSSGQSSEKKVKMDSRFIMTMVGLSMAFTVAEVIPLYLATAFTIVAVDLDAIDSLVWILITPYISTGAVAPFVGSLTDIFGRKWIIIASLIITIIAAIIQGAAPYFSAFMVGQVLSGIGIGIQLLTVASGASELVPVRQRGMTYAFIAAGILPMAPAPLYGQLMAQHSWRWIYLVIGCWAAIAAVVLTIWYDVPPPPKADRKSKMQTLARLDYVGWALSTVGLVLFLVGLNSAGNNWPWDSAPVICFMVFGGLLMVAFIGWEVWLNYRTPNWFPNYRPYPMVPAQVLQYKRQFIATSVLALTSGINYIPLTVFWTIEVYTVYHASYVEAGIWLLPLGFCQIGGAAICAALITVFPRRIQWIMFFFCIMQVVGIATMACVDPDDISTAWPSIVFGLVGVGAVLLPSQVIFTIISPDEYLGTTVSISIALRMLGQVVGKSMYYSIFETRVTANALTTFVPAAFKVGIYSPSEIEYLLSILTGGPLSAYLDQFPQIDTQAKYDLIIKAGQQTYFPAFPLLDYVSIAWGGTALIACLALWGIHRFIDDRIVVRM